MFSSSECFSGQSKLDKWLWPDDDAGWRVPQDNTNQQDRSSCGVLWKMESQSNSYCDISDWTHWTFYLWQHCGAVVSTGFPERALVRSGSFCFEFACSPHVYMGFLCGFTTAENVNSCLCLSIRWWPAQVVPHLSPNINWDWLILILWRISGVDNE